MMRLGGNTPPLLMWRHMLGGGALADAYAVGGNAPEFVADFSGSLNSGTEYYRSGGSDTTFSSVFTHSGLVAPATMTDSDGVLKWATHNFIDNSQNFSAWDLIANRGSVTSNTVTAPDGTTTADTFTEGTASSTTHFVGNTCGTGIGAIVPVGGRVRISVFAKAGDRSHIALGMTSSSHASDWDEADQAYFDLSNGTKGYDENGSGTIVSVGDGWYLCSVDFTPANNAVYPAVFLATGTSNGNNSFSGDPATYPSGVYLWGAHSYRIDLGGMANNPDRGDSYVPTTTAARYLPRRNHHIYNGSTYDNAGILIEPADATNLVTQSRTLSTTWQISSAGRVQFGTPTTGPDSVSGSAQLLEVGATSGSNARGYNFILTTTSVAHAHSYILQDGPGGTGWVSIATQDDTDGIKYSYFDLRNGVKGTTATGHTTYMTELFDGWYRCTVVNTFASATGTRTWLLMATGDGAVNVDSATYPQGTGWVYFYHAQCETGSIATSPIITSGASVTRAAETLTVAGANLPYSATAMSFQQQGRMNFADTDSNPTLTFFDWRGTGAYLGQRIQTNAANTGLFVGYSLGDISFDVTDDYVPGINVSYNNASRHTNDLVQAAKQGSAHTADSDPTAVPNVSSGTLHFGTNFLSVTSPPFIVALFRAWGTDIGEAGIEEASS